MPGAGGMVSGLLTRWTANMRFPQLFLLAGSLFLIDLLIPDLIPFIDEILLGLATLLLGSWRARPARKEPKPPMKDITPRG